MWLPKLMQRFSSSFVGLAIVFFCYNGFSGIISVADLQNRFEAIVKAANGKVGVGFRRERLFTMLRDTPDAEKRIKLAFGCLLTAVGIPMILAGEELSDY